MWDLLVAVVCCTYQGPREVPMSQNTISRGYNVDVEILKALDL